MENSESGSTRVRASRALTSGFLYRVCLKAECPRHMVTCHLSVPTCNYECHTNIPSTDRPQSFRSRLQRALSLSPAESEVSRSHSRLAAGDTAEEEEVHQEENDCASRQGWGIAVDSIEEDARPDWNTRPNLGKELGIPGQPDVSGNCNMIALQCIAE